MHGTVHSNMRSNLHKSWVKREY